MPFRPIRPHPDFSLGMDGTLLFRNRLCVLGDPDLKHEILEEAHCLAYAMHPGSTKMYRTIRENYW